MMGIYHALHSPVAGVPRTEAKGRSITSLGEMKVPKHDYYKDAKE